MSSIWRVLPLRSGARIVPSHLRESCCQANTSASRGPRSQESDRRIQHGTFSKAQSISTWAPGPSIQKRQPITGCGEAALECGGTTPLSSSGYALKPMLNSENRGYREAPKRRRVAALQGASKLAHRVSHGRFSPGSRKKTMLYGAGLGKNGDSPVSARGLAALGTVPVFPEQLSGCPQRRRWGQLK